ncbi:MAG TPA: nucleoside 2-deoxyribosyltransferase [Longimicrobium sp.]|nr:nucleoside 2-deoxyribosyltransferase [Longimicrobium sp.]
MSERRRIFIACPISKYLRNEGGMDPGFEAFIRDVHQTCRRYGDDVFLALEREAYGQAVMDDVTCTPLDFEALRAADVVVAIPEDSMGVAVELGWASALGKEIVLVLDPRFRYSPLITALHCITTARTLMLPDGGPTPAAARRVAQFLHPLLARGAPHPEPEVAAAD